MAELVWEDPPVPDTPFFTKDLYDKYSLAPNVRDLWAFLQSPIKNGNTKQESDVAAAKTSSCSSTEEAAEHKDNSRISKEDSCQSDEACADNAAESPEECNKTKTSNVIPKQVENEAVVAFPEPRLPYPCMSTLSINDQKTYLGFLMSKKTRNPPQNLMGRVNNEVMQFTRYLQDVAKVCADDYNFIPQGAEQYSEEFFRACLECIKTFPQLYQIHEMTSLTGGTFNPALTLTFEKQLLIMGSVDITDHKIVPADAQLASDYQSVSSENPPAKKAKDMHATVSDDANAEKLCARYEPHVCLTRDALLTLLNNHGPDFVEPWELPIWIKLNPGKGRSQKKTVYIDSPLLKTEVTIRERSHIYHEESVKLSFIKNGSKNMFHLMTELPVDEKQQSPESSQRNVVSFDNDGLDFEGDLTDLETFGETTSIKTPKMLKLQTEQNQCVASKKATKRKTSSEHIANTSSSSLEETNPSMTNTDDPMTTEKAQLLQVKPASAEESEEDVAFTEDSDEEKLIIDVSPAATSKTQTKLESTSCSSDTFITPVSATVPVNSSESPSPQKVKGLTRQPKKTKTGDQLGEILRMQTAMFNSSANDAGKCSTRSQETNSPARCTGHSVSSHQTSLVKSCVSSYLERNQNEEGQTCSTPHKSTPVVNVNSIEHKKMLSEDLQAGAEDEQDYTSPEEGNLLYKLYSLQDLLVMVRSSVSLTHSRKTVSNQNQYVPVHVLPKLEYQLNYGVECLTSSESCQLWTETLLHSSTVSYIAHINAHTSKVALLRKLPDNWKQNISCGFKPSKSLNILHHLLKKLAGLDEGRYLIVHKAAEPFVTLLKEATRKVNRGAFNLQQLHSSVPQPPASAPSPWIPVDPAVVLPFHQAHGRVPCTFPPNPFQKTTRDGAFQTNNRGAGQSKNNTAAGGNKKKKQSKRTAKRNKYIRKLIQKSV